MIPVVLQPEPPEFDEKVRRKGQEWLTQKGIAFHLLPPAKTKFPPYWSWSNKPLWDAYAGVCAYLAIFFEWDTGASSTDHFVAKSKHAGMAYEWDNYRLSCLGPNRNKNKYDDVLDPVGVAPNTFFLNLANGEIRLNSALSNVDKALARKTIKRLKLNSPTMKAMRMRHFNQYLRHQDAQTLKEISPFVWHEANRQSLFD